MTVRRVGVCRVGGVFGLYMSKPGVDLATAAENDMIFSPNKNFFQVAHERRITFPQVIRSSLVRVVRRIDHPDLGFIPTVTIDNNSTTFSYAAGNWLNVVAKPVSTKVFGQTQTGFYLVRHTLETFSSPAIINPGGIVTIRLYKVPRRTTGYPLPAYDILEPDA